MKVYIGPYRTWIGPYQIAGVIKYLGFSEEQAYDFGAWLADDKNGNPTWLSRFCSWIHSKIDRKIQVKLHYYDHWSVDNTLSHIIAPLLVQLKENKHSFGLIDDEDVPEELRSDKAPPKQNEYDWDANASARYDWFMDEIIWAFTQQSLDDPEEQKYFDHSDVDRKTDIMNQVKQTKYDHEGHKAYIARKQNAFRLFGKYYQTLWD